MRGCFYYDKIPTEKHEERRGWHWLSCLIGRQQKAPVVGPGLAGYSVSVDGYGAGVDEIASVTLFVDLDFGNQLL
ncbi:MAG: hypothetical protein ACRDCI_09755, partial [Plesiomonas shigelloides]